MSKKNIEYVVVNKDNVVLHTFDMRGDAEQYRKIIKKSKQKTQSKIIRREFIDEYILS